VGVTEAAQERDRLGGVTAIRGGLAAAGCGGDIHKAVVVGGSVQVGDVLLRSDEGELGMHGDLVSSCGSSTVIRTACSALTVR
jgi:hypothetical protein